ncbi:MAG: DUF4177 domain-containing protein [Lysobacter sp.]|nr:MAG: DUF4177 domain-containing protein [Lysobacter sp.]
MSGRRWSYKVVEVKPTWRGVTAEALDTVLAQLGQQDWELVSAAPMGMAVRLFLKKEL